MTVKEALEKIDNTLCLNSQSLRFNIDTEEHIDCKDTYEMVECLETIEKELTDLKKIEEDLGIDLVILFKALNIFYSKEHECYCPRPTSLFKSVEGEWSLVWMYSYYKLKDYGKTWALTKEELE